MRDYRPRVVGFKVLAAIHSGQITFNCLECSNDDKKIWGCEEPASSAAWVDGENQFYSCPFKFIPEVVFMWFEEYQYSKTFKTAPDYSLQSAKFCHAMSIYENEYASRVESIRKRKGGR